MFDPRFLKAAVSNTTIYPNRQAVSCDMIGTDNKVYVANHFVEDVDLGLYLKCHIFKKLTRAEQDKLLKLIEGYGDSRSQEGAFDATYEG